MVSSFLRSPSPPVPGCRANRRSPARTRMAAEADLRHGRILPVLIAIRSLLPLRIVAALSLPAYPFGTLVGGWLLYHLSDPSLQAILREDYRAVVAATPHLDPKPSNGPIILGVMLAFGMLAFGAFSAMVV